MPVLENKNKNKKTKKKQRNQLFLLKNIGSQPKKNTIQNKTKQTNKKTKPTRFNILYIYIVCQENL